MPEDSGRWDVLVGPIQGSFESPFDASMEEPGLSQGDVPLEKLAQPARVFPPTPDKPGRRPSDSCLVTMARPSSQ